MSPVSEGGSRPFAVDMKLHGLYVITDVTLCSDRTHVDIARAALEGGARIIQMRDKTAPDREFYVQALALRKITSDAGALFLINDRVDIAAAVRADGVNVGQTDLPVAAVRTVVGTRMLVGVSAGSVDEARQAEMDGASYVGFGPVFDTATKPDAGPATGLDALRNVCRLLDVPVVGIGGIDRGNIGAVAKCGAACAAVVSAVVCATDMALAAAELMREFDGGRHNDPA